MSYKAAMMRWYRQDISAGTNPWSVAFDGVNVWVTNPHSNSVSELRATDGATLATYPVGVASQCCRF